jgi:hypothetical protein
MDYQRLTTRVPDGLNQLGCSDLGFVPQRARVLGKPRWDNDQRPGVVPHVHQSAPTIEDVERGSHGDEVPCVSVESSIFVSAQFDRLH